MSLQQYVIKPVNSHVEVFDNRGRFVSSADSIEEAMQDLRAENYEK